MTDYCRGRRLHPQQRECAKVGGLNEIAAVRLTIDWIFDNPIKGALQNATIATLNEVVAPHPPDQPIKVLSLIGDNDGVALLCHHIRLETIAEPFEEQVLARPGRMSVDDRTRRKAGEMLQRLAEDLRSNVAPNCLRGDIAPPAYPIGRVHLDFHVDSVAFFDRTAEGYKMIQGWKPLIRGQDNRGEATRLLVL